MGLDRDVYWKGDRRPTKDEIRMVCEDFLGGAGTVEQDQHCTTMTLPGRCSHPLQRMPGAPPYLGGEALRDLRVSLDLSLGAAARALGLTVVEFSALERGGMVFAEEGHWEAAGDALRKAVGGS